MNLSTVLLHQAICAKQTSSPVTFYRIYQGYRMKGYSKFQSYLSAIFYCN